MNPRAQNARRYTHTHTHISSIDRNANPRLETISTIKALAQATSTSIHISRFGQHSLCSSTITMYTIVSCIINSLSMTSLATVEVIRSAFSKPMPKPCHVETRWRAPRSSRNHSSDKRYGPNARHSVIATLLIILHSLKEGHHLQVTGPADGAVHDDLYHLHGADRPQSHGRCPTLQSCVPLGLPERTERQVARCVPKLSETV